jgi:hypothetical protein
MIESAAKLADSPYNTSLFQAMCVFAFFAFLRIGEITLSNTGNTIQLQQLTKLVNDKKEVEALKITFLNYKHSYNQPPFSLVISRRSTY